MYVIIDLLYKKICEEWFKFILEKLKYKENERHPMPGKSVSLDHLSDNSLRRHSKMELWGFFDN